MSCSVYPVNPDLSTHITLKQQSQIPTGFFFFFVFYFRHTHWSWNNSGPITETHFDPFISILQTALSGSAGKQK